MALNVGELYATLGLDTKGFDRGLSGADTALGKLLAVGKKIAKTGLGLGTAFGGAALVTGYKRLTSIEDATASMTVQLGSASKAADLMNRVLAVSKGTPFSFDQFASASKQLVAFGVSTQKIPGYLRAIGEAAAATGTGSEGLNQIATAFGKMSARGRIYMDDVWQISESGTSALTILANGYGVSTSAMQNMISKGQVPASKAMDLLTQGIMKGSRGVAGSTRALGGTMDALGKTTSGAMANAKAAVARFGAAALKPVFDRLPGVLQGASTELDRLGKVVGPALAGFINSKGAADGVDRIRNGLSALVNSPALTDFGEQIVTLGGNLMKLATTALPPLLHDLAQVGKVVAGAVLGGLHGMNAILGPLAKHGELLIPILEGLAAGLVAMHVVVKLQGALLKFRKMMLLLNGAMAANPAVFIAGALVALGVAVYSAYRHIKPFHDAVDKVGRVLRDTVWPAIRNVAMAVGGALVDAWHAAEGPLGTALGVITDLGRGFTTYLVEPIRTAVGVIVDLFHGDFAGAFDLITALPGKLIDGFGDLPGQLLGLLSKIPGVLADAFASAGLWLLQEGPKILGGLVEGLVAGLSKVMSFFSGMIGKVRAALAPIVEVILAPFRMGIDNAKAVIGTVIDVVRGLAGKVKTALVGLGTILLAPFKWGIDHGKSVITGIVDFAKSLPTKVKNALVGLGSALLAPFRWMMDKLKGFWNNTIGRISFTVPSWVPAIGGKGWSFPKMHSGGWIPGGPGNEPLIQAQGGEYVLDRAKAAAFDKLGLLGRRVGVAASAGAAGRAGFRPGAGGTPGAAMVTERTGDTIGMYVDKAYFDSGLDLDAAMSQMEFIIRQARL